MTVYSFTEKKRIRKSFRGVDPDFAQIENYAGFGYRWLSEE